MTIAELTTEFSWLLTYRYAGVAVGSFALGDTVVIGAGYLAGTGLLNFWLTLGYALIGTLIADCAWFLFGHQIIRRLPKYRNLDWQINMVEKIERLAGKRLWLIILCFKFLYGTRILMIIFFSLQKISLVRFLWLDTVGTLIWLILFLGVGWLAGAGIVNLLPHVQSAELALTIFVLVLLVMRLGFSWMEKRLTKSE